MAILITPNNIMRPAKLEFKLTQEDDGIYTIENVYDGPYTFFENVPLGENGQGKTAEVDCPQELNTGREKI
jgi:hypothetical protein